mmetsp:Transcript_25579/g.84506  ORF Transcript_25579/g.84506 Transcript_25579/m.84506 type:complete len:229 (+) Transcript_25579:356-1042(+)
MVSISLVFMVLSSKKIISEKGTPLALLRFWKCFLFDPGKISLYSASSATATPGAASNFSSRCFAHSTLFVLDAMATFVPFHASSVASSCSAPLAPSNSHTSLSALGLLFSWYSSGVHRVLSRSKTTSLGRAQPLGSFATCRPSLSPSLLLRALMHTTSERLEDNDLLDAMPLQPCDPGSSARARRNRRRWELMKMNFITVLRTQILANSPFDFCQSPPPAPGPVNSLP